VNEICLSETMQARCRWNSEVIVMTSARWGRMKTGQCLKINPKWLASNSDDPMFLGCYEDVLSLLDMKCSLKPSCDVVVPNPDLDKVTPCYQDLTRYLEASYTCVKGNFVCRCHSKFLCNFRFLSRDPSAVSAVEILTGCLSVRPSVCSGSACTVTNLQKETTYS